MPYQVEKIADHDHVVLVIFSGNMTAQDVSQAVADVVKIAEMMPDPTYQIGDFRGADGSFRSVMNIVRTFPAMVRIYRDEGIIGPIVVQELNNRWLRLSSDLARKMNLTPFISFATIDDALDHITTKLYESLN